MNSRLRTRHRSIMTVLAIVLPVVFVAGLVMRPPIQRMDSLPVVEAESLDFPVLVANGNGVSIDGAILDLGLYRASNDAGRYAVEVDPQAGQAVKAADVLVYWSKSTDTSASIPPRDAYLLGTLAGPQTRLFALPPAAKPGTGRLVFYSLAQKRLFSDDWPLPAVDDRS